MPVTPEDGAATKESYTGQYLKPVMARAPSAPSGRLPAGESEGASKRAKKQAAE
jgi:excinuclease ABC subunit A